jgi:hypothetical protein
LSALLSALTRLLLLLVGALSTAALLLPALVLATLAALMLTALASALILVRHLVFLSNYSRQEDNVSFNALFL